MPPSVDRIARELIEQHGTKAVYVAVERLNQDIDKGDRTGRDFWAQVVHAIHEYERSVSNRPRKRRVARTSRLPADAR